MAIDIIFIILLLMAVSKGMQRGLVLAVFSVLACIAGLAAAIKLSAVVAVRLNGHLPVSPKWLPILAFILVFLVVVMIVRWVADIVETTVDFAFMEWLNKLGGVVLYLVLYISVYSVLLFYGTQSGIIGKHSVEASKTYSFIEPWGPAIMLQLGKIAPIFRDMFVQLQTFFAGLSR
ncbi:MAG TPA: CvpA family protein [Puia sp.]|nr:CvpA family protein [Puia sp.]